jgi:hypothetical protein
MMGGSRSLRRCNSGNVRVDFDFIPENANRNSAFRVQERAPIAPLGSRMSAEFKHAAARQLSLEDWAEAQLPGTPPLPWMGDQGQQIASFMLLPIPECSTGATVVFMDAQGATVDVRNDGPMYRMAEALNPPLGQLTLLPDVFRIPRKQ